jgi:hypothetical protein
MKIRFLQSVSSVSGSYSVNTEYDVPEVDGKSWVKNGWAIQVVSKKKQPVTKVI